MLFECADTVRNIQARISSFVELGIELAYLGDKLHTADVIQITEAYQGRSCFQFREYGRDIWEGWWVHDPAGVHEAVSDTGTLRLQRSSGQ